MPLLNASLQKQVREVLDGMVTPVTLAVFTTDADEHACEICADTRQLVEELAWLSDGKITAEVYDIHRDVDRAATYRVDRAPAIVVLGGDGGHVDYGIRFFGIPSGYEFATLVQDVRMVSAGQVQLSAATEDALKRITTPIHVKVFVTPTCPYCPRAVLLAHRLAFKSELVTSDMIDASEFPELADRYNVRAVPKTVVNDVVQIEGAVPEDAFVEELTPLLASSAA